MLASASADGTVRLWDTSTGAHRRTIKGCNEWVRKLAFSPDGKTLAWDFGYTVRLWDTATGVEKETLRDHSNEVILFAFSPDGMTLASSSKDGTVRLWDANTGSQKQKFEVEQTRKLSFSSDGCFLYTDKGVFDITRGILTASLPSNILGLASDEQWIVYGSEPLLWLPPEYRIGEFRILGRSVNELEGAFDVFGDMVALGHQSGDVVIIKFDLGGLIEASSYQPTLQV
jgi:WD40 repeat protein